MSKKPVAVRRIEGGAPTLPRTAVYNNGWVNGTRLHNNDLAETTKRTLETLQLPLCAPVCHD